MSTVFLHVGQCGVQVGENMWSKVAKTNDRDVKHVMTVPGLKTSPRALFIDGEEKVIKKCISNFRKNKVNLNINNNFLSAKSGCGSNFAFGMNKLGGTIIGNNLPPFEDVGYTNHPNVDKNSSYMDVCLEMIRLKIESCNSFSGFCVTHSLAGGTGSGFGSQLAIKLYDLYPTAFRLWNVIAPYSGGESPCQNYNQLICLSTLQQYTDAIVIFNNEFLLDQIYKNKPQVSMADLNEIISNMLLGCYLPVTSLKCQSNHLSIGNEPWEIVRSLAPVPSLKLLQMRQATLSDRNSYCGAEKVAWNKLLQNISLQVKSDTWNGGSCHPTLSSVCICRGFTNTHSSDNIINKLQKNFKFVDWNPYPVDFWTDSSPSNRSLLGRSITLCSNASSLATCLVRDVAVRSRLMHKHRAYLHWYQKYGVDDDDFINAFTVLENVVHEYKEAIK